MKKLLLIALLIVGCGIAQEFDTSDWNNSAKVLLYDSEKKSPVLGVGLSIILPSSGHAYLGNWKRGQFFQAGKFGVISLAEYISSKKWDEDTAIGTILFVFTIGGLIEGIDVIKQTSKYNLKLHKQIFGVDSSSLNFKLQPTYQGANLTMSYSFK